ncbi:MAG: hypothetical protein IPO75_15930 [Betaproteobacteria bacterium]|nr:hypothetical protein [Betaproteobacteria bacterium]
MNTQEMIVALRQMLAQLEAVNPDAEPPGMVAVRPTGVKGAGIVRYWPEPKPTEGENAWGYMIRMARTKDASGLYWFPPQLIGSYGLMQTTMPARHPWPEQADRLTHREMWLTQEDARPRSSGAGAVGRVGYEDGWLNLKEQR